MLLTYPVVNRALLNQLFPLGTLQKNVGTVRLDDPSRRNPYTHQFSLGYEQQLGGQMSVSVDYLRKQLRETCWCRSISTRVCASTRREPARSTASIRTSCRRS